MSNIGDIIYKDDRYTLVHHKEHGLLLTMTMNDETYELSSHAYEPCTYIDHDGFCAVMHHGFDIPETISNFRKNLPVCTEEYKDISPVRFCEIMVSTWREKFLTMRSEQKQQIVRETGTKTAAKF